MAVGRPLTTPFTLTSETPGALVGKESREGRDALRADPSENLLVIDVARGESGDASDLYNFSAEIWWKCVGALPAPNDLILSGPLDTNAQFQYYLQVNSAGTISWHADTAGVNPVVTGGTVAGGDTTWYHLVGTVDAATSRLYVNGVQVASSASSNAIFPVTGTGDFSVGDGAGSGSYAYDEVAVYRYTLPADRVLAHYQAGAERGYRIQATGARINSVLSTVSSTAPSSVQAGTRNVAPVFMHGQSPLDEIRRARGAENIDALFFVARDGTLTFLADGHRSSSPYNTVQATFDDDGTDLEYQGLDLDYSESFLANDWTVTRAAGEAQTVSGHNQSFPGTRNGRKHWVTCRSTTDAEALAISTALLAKYKDPLTRVQQISLSTADPAVTETVFKRDIGDRIRVLRTPPGGGARIDQTLFIQKIQVDASPDGPWRISWTVSPV